MERILFFERVFANPDYTDIFGNNWLMIASDTSLDCFEKMLEFEEISRKDILHKNKYGNTIFDLIQTNGQLKVTQKDRLKVTKGSEQKLCDFLYQDIMSDTKNIYDKKDKSDEKIHVNTTINKSQETLLLIAFRCNNLNVVEKLLDIKECNVNHQDKNGNGVLFTIIKWFEQVNLYGSVHCLAMIKIISKLLRRNDYDVNTSTPDKKQSLISVLLSGLMDYSKSDAACEILETLLENPKCDVMMSELESTTADNIYDMITTLTPPSDKSHQIIKKLINHQTFDPNYTFTKDKDTLLIRASFCCNFDIVLNLLDDKKCSLYETNSTGLNAIDYIVKNTFTDKKKDIGLTILKKLTTFNEFDFNKPLKPVNDYTDSFVFFDKFDTIAICACYKTYYFVHYGNYKGGGKLYDIIDFLLDCPKLDVNFRRKKCRAIFWYLFRLAEEKRTKCHLDLLKKLITRKELDVIRPMHDEYYSSVLYRIISSKLNDVISVCINNHVNDKDSQGMTMIEYAIRELNSNTIERILLHPSFVPDQSYGINAIKTDITKKYSDFFSKYTRQKLLNIINYSSLSKITESKDKKNITCKTGSITQKKDKALSVDRNNESLCHNEETISLISSNGST